MVWISNYLLSLGTLNFNVQNINAYDNGKNNTVCEPKTEQSLIIETKNTCIFNLFILIFNVIYVNLTSLKLQLLKK